MFAMKEFLVALSRRMAFKEKFLSQPRLQTACSTTQRILFFQQQINCFSSSRNPFKRDQEKTQTEKPR
jgi:hypothetical protein